MGVYTDLAWEHQKGGCQSSDIEFVRSEFSNSTNCCWTEFIRGPLRLHIFLPKAGRRCLYNVQILFLWILESFGAFSSFALFQAALYHFARQRSGIKVIKCGCWQLQVGKHGCLISLLELYLELTCSPLNSLWKLTDFNKLKWNVNMKSSTTFFLVRTQTTLFYGFLIL